MKRSSTPSLVKGLLAMLVVTPVVAGCRAASTTQQMPAELHAGAHAHAEAAVTSSSGVAGDGGARRGYSDADVRFMQQMIGHHGQALTMTALVPARSRSEAIRLIAERIAVSQRDEVAAMRRWLEARREAAPAVDAHDAHHAPHGSGGAGPLMPGMLSAEELERLASTHDAEFDQLFLQYMIRHHEGALTMVAGLFSTNGAGEEPELFRLASDVDADQRAEIARLRALQLSSAPSQHHP